MQRIRVTIVALFTAVATLLMIAPANAASALVIEPSAPLRVGNNIECQKQFVAPRDGTVVDNFTAEPRIQYKKVTKQQRRWIPDRWVRDDFPIWNSRRLEKGHWYYPPDKVTWPTVGGLADKRPGPGREVRLYARVETPGVQYNAKPARWDERTQKYVGFKWNFVRANPPGQQELRCVLFFTGRVTDDTGTRYNVSVAKESGTRRF